MVGDDSTFFGEALDMFRLLLKMAERNEKREVGVLVPRGLEHAVKSPLHPFPESISPGTDHHASTNFRILCHLGRTDDLLVPLGKIFLATRGNSAFVAFAHKLAKLAFWLLVTQESGAAW